MTLSLANQGFDYVAYYNGAYSNSSSLDALDATGANSVELSLDYGIDPQTSTVYADSNITDSLADLGMEIRQAVALGLSVMVRPLIDFVDAGDMTGTSYSVDEWRSYYNPDLAGSTTANAFFASYQTMILQEAAVAVANGATSLCIGSELDEIAGPSYLSYWNSIISALRTEYPTLKLTYSADWDDDLSPWQYGGSGLAAGTGDLATQVSFASELDSIGVDCYAPISDAANPTLAQLVTGWTQTPTDSTSLAVTGGKSLISYFESVAAAVGKPLVFTELGYENASDAASQPFYSSTNVVDSTLQALLYQAFFEAWQKDGNTSLAGVYFWNWDPNAAEVGPGQGANFGPQGLPAQAIATDWFGDGPQITFNAPTLAGNGKITLTGTAYDSVGAQSVELYNGTTKVGAASVNGTTGAWSFSKTLAAGQYRFNVLATDQDGKQSSALASFVVATGITGQSYTGSISDYDAAGYLLWADYVGVTAEGNLSSFEYLYGGNNLIGTDEFYTGITGKPYTGQETDYNGAGGVTRDVYSGVTGQPFSSYGYDFVGGVYAGAKFAFTSVPAGASYSFYMVDENSANAFSGEQFYSTNVTGQSYTGEEQEFDANSKLSESS
jgi:hypothetical protein